MPTVRDFVAFAHHPGTPNAEQIATRFYRHRSVALFAKELPALAKLNTRTTDGYGSLMFLTSAVLRTIGEKEREDLLGTLEENVTVETASLVAMSLAHIPGDSGVEAWVKRTGLADWIAPTDPFNPLEGMPMGPSAVNALWSEFSATGSIAALELISSTLPSWNDVVRQMRAQKRDPSRTVISGAGHSSRWSLAANARTHELVREFCEVRALSPSVDATEREELFAILGELEADQRERPRDTTEAQTLDFARTNGATVIDVHMPAIPRPKNVKPFDTAFLDVTTNAWRDAIFERLPTLAAADLAIASVEHASDATTELSERQRLALHAGLIADTASYANLTVHNLQRAIPGEGPVAFDNLLIEAAVKALRWDVALDRLEPMSKRKVENEVTFAQYMVNIAKKLGDRARLISAYEFQSDVHERRLAAKANADDRYALATSLIERAKLTNSDELWSRGLNELTKVADEVPSNELEVARAWFNRGMGLRREERWGPSSEALELSLKRFARLGPDDELNKIGATHEAKMLIAANLRELGNLPAAAALARETIASVNALDPKKFAALISHVNASLAALASQ